MTFDQWINDHPICPRVAELRACWEAAQAAMRPMSPEYQLVGYGWFENGVLAGSLAERTPPLFTVPLYVLASERIERRRHDL